MSVASETMSLARWSPGTDLAASAVGLRLDFAAVNTAAMSELPTLFARWLPDQAGAVRRLINMLGAH